MPPKRIDKVNELLRREISALFARELEFAKGTVVTVASVKAEPRLEHATVYVSIYPSGKKDATLSVIQKRSPFIQGLLNRRLHMAHIPQLRYEYDVEGNELFELDSLIDKANQESV